MADTSYDGLLLIVLVASAAPLLVDLPRRFRLPAVVVELVSGIVIGPQGLGWVHVNAPVQVLATIGLAFLLFLAGMEIDLHRLRGPLARVAATAFLLSIALALACGYLLSALHVDGKPLLLATVLLSTSLGVLVPVLRDSGDSGSDFGQLVLVAGSLAEFGALLALTLFFSQEASSEESQLLLLAVFALVIVVLSVTIARAWRSPWLSAAFRRMDDSSSQLRVRAAMVLLVTFVVLADRLGLEAILGAFAAGLALRAADNEESATRAQFASKLDAIGYGFLVPVFFVTSGLQFDLHALLARPATIALVPLLLLALVVVRGVPALLYAPRFGRRPAMAAGFLQATSLTFIVVAANIGIELGKLSSGTAAALIAAGLLSLVVCPLVALGLRPWSPRPSDTRDGL